MFESERSPHDGNGLAAGDGGTARTGTRAAGGHNGGGGPTRADGETDGEREGFIAGQVEELRRMASVLQERFALAEQDSLRLAREAEQNDGRAEKLMAAQDALAELHERNPAAFAQAVAFVGILLRVTEETERPSSVVLGERNGASKLTEAAVLSIRRRHPKGESMEALAREYGVCRGTIKDVVKHRTWKEIRRDDRERRGTK